MRGFTRKLLLLFGIALLLFVAACGSSSKVKSDSNQIKTQGKAEVQQIKQQDPAVQKQINYAENHVVVCLGKVKGHVKKQEGTFLTCEGISPQEQKRAKPCLNSTLNRATPSVLRSSTKRDQLVTSAVKCTTR